jgi:uncharacterized membrane protein YfbV (UPF0208 family)
MSNGKIPTKNLSFCRCVFGSISITTKECKLATGFKTMNFQVQTLVTNLQGYFKKFVVGLAILTLVWQSAILGVDNAIASPLVATSASSMSKQMTGTAEQMKGAATKSIGKAQSAMEDKASEAKMKVKDNLTEAKIKIKGNNARVENAADKATEKVKNFFGK